MYWIDGIFNKGLRHQSFPFKQVICDIISDLAGSHSILQDILCPGVVSLPALQTVLYSHTAHCTQTNTQKQRIGSHFKVKGN